MAKVNELVGVGDGIAYAEKRTFLIVSSLFFAFAVLFVAGRSLAKVRHGESFHIYDFVLYFGLACLVAGTAVMHTVLPDLYVSLALSLDEKSRSTLPRTDLVHVTSTVTTYLAVFHCLAWTCIFGAKFSLLAFLKGFVNKRDKMRLYWLAAISVTCFCWAYMVVIPFIACPYFGDNAMQCSSAGRQNRLHALGHAGTAVDCVTTILICSIPCIISRDSYPNRRQRYTMGILLVLSSAMIVISVFRSAKITTSTKDEKDTPFQTLLTYVEACIALAMASATTFRSLFIQFPLHNLPQSQHMQWTSGTLTKRPRPSTESQEKLNGIFIPSARMNGLRTVVRGGAMPTKKKETGLTRNASVVRTREVVVEVSYENDMERDPWVTSPSWLRETRPSAEEKR